MLNARHLLLIGCLSCAGLLLLTQCAVRKAPGGGPEDKTPPSIISTFPVPDSTGVLTLEYIEVEFDEPIDQTSVRNQVWLSPEPPTAPEIKWENSRTLRLALSDSLLPDQTYLLTVGTGVKDIRGNEIEEPLTLPFSSGDKIDQGAISGLLDGGKTEGTFIYAYKLDGEFPDSTIATIKPPYFTQVNKEGRYRIQYLKEGDYRLFALADGNGDRLYTLQADRLGLPHSDLSLDSLKLTVEQFNFALLEEDTTAPKKGRIRSENYRQIQLRFNESLDSTQTFVTSLFDSVSQATIPALRSERSAEDPSHIHAWFEGLEEIDYIATVTTPRDLYGNAAIEPTQEFRFRGSGDKDVDSTSFTGSDPSSSRQGVWGNAPLFLHFSNPIDSATLPSAFTFYNSDSLAQSGSWSWESWLSPAFQPDSALQKGDAYWWELDLSLVKDIWGQVIDDSTYSGRFTLLAESELGEISGVVSSRDSTVQQALLIARNMGSDIIIRDTVKIGETYEMVEVPDGIYRLQAILDRNANGRFDRGRSRPFEFAEPFQIYADTVRVRKRWTTQGINFDF